MWRSSLTLKAVVLSHKFSKFLYERTCTVYQLTGSEKANLSKILGMLLCPLFYIVMYKSGSSMSDACAIGLTLCYC